MESLESAFKRSALLQKHVQFLYTAGSIYKVFNKNLMFHGCVPMTEDGGFESVTLFDGRTVSGRKYMDCCDRIARSAYYNGDQNSLDFMFYLWCGRQSPLFGRGKMTTFERYFVADKETWKESKNPYYDLIEKYDAVCNILHEFGLDENESHIVNGHVPVRVGQGERPIKANGRYILIDGGFCKAYHTRTGIAGYTLIYTSKGLRLVSHSSFEGKMAAVKENKDILAAEDVIFEMMPKRMFVVDTDEGEIFLDRINDLRDLLEAYREGVVSQNKKS